MRITSNPETSTTNKKTRGEKKMNHRLFLFPVKEPQKRRRITPKTKTLWNPEVTKPKMDVFWVYFEIGRKREAQAHKPHPLPPHKKTYDEGQGVTGEYREARQTQERNKNRSGLKRRER